MGKIVIEGMHFFANHGCLPSERELGNNFYVDLEIDVNTSSVEISDSLKDALDYSYAHKIVTEQMMIPSNMLENVARRIIDKLKSVFPQIEKVKVKVTKMQPPIKAKIEKVSIIIEE